MSLEEIAAFLRGIEKKERTGWEQARLQSFYVLASQGSKAKKPEDLLKFPWEIKETKPRKLSKRELNKRIKEGEEWLAKKT